MKYSSKIQNRKLMLSTNVLKQYITRAPRTGTIFNRNIIVGNWRTFTDANGVRRIDAPAGVP